MDATKRRLAKELTQMLKEPPAGVRFMQEQEGQAGSNLMCWGLILEGARNTVYEGEIFQLQFRFDDDYPFSPPEVVFTGEHIPVHPHVYSNGHICLSTLSDDWTPALSTSSVCLSIQSMLSSCKDKKPPPDNAIYVRSCNKNPNKTRWWFHDDKV